jgi:hypothetical protein
MKIKMIKFSEIKKMFIPEPVVEQKKENRGGKREGAGPPFKYGEPTCNVTLRVPKSKKAEVKKLVYEYLNQFLIKP